MYHDRLMNEGEALEWGICGVGVHARDRAMKEALDAQDGLYTLVVKHADGTLRAARDRLDRRVPVRARRPRGGDREAGRRDDADRLADRHRGRLQPRPRHRRVRRRRPGVQHDLEPGAVPRRFGLVTEALARRRERGLAPFTVMSCDNLQGNGDLTPPGVHGVRAARATPSSASGSSARSASRTRWSTGSRPQTTDADRDEVRERFGIEDALAGGLRAVHAVGARGRASPPGARRTRTPACRSSRTSSRTS